MPKRKPKPEKSDLRPTPGPNKAHFAVMCDLAIASVLEMLDIHDAEGKIPPDVPRDRIKAMLHEAFDGLIANQRMIEIHLAMTERACQAKQTELDATSTPRRRRALQREVDEAQVALEEIELTRQALARGDARAAAMAAFFTGYHAHSILAYESASWGGIARRNADKLSDPNRTQGQRNQKAVRDAHARIIAKEPGIQHKQLMKKLRKETGLKDRAIYKHLKQNSTAQR